jgi:hypothetical protein
VLPERFRHATHILPIKPLAWQIRMTLRVGAVGPAVATLILMTATYLPLLAARTGPIDAPGLIVVFIFFAVPIGYVFGVVPALLAGAMYSGVLTAMETRRTGMLPRASLAALCGGSVCGIWFHAVAGPGWRGYAAVGALVAALLSLRWPRPRTLRNKTASLRLPEHPLDARAPEPRSRDRCDS